MDNPGVGLGAVRDELAAPDRLPSVRGSHPSTSLWECRVVQHSKMGRSMSAGGSPAELAVWALMSAIAGCGHTVAWASDRVVPCMDGARSAREKNLTFSRNVRVQPCIRPLNAAVVAAGPDVIH